MATSGVRASYKKDGLDLNFSYNMADVVALSAVGVGVAGMVLPELISTAGGLMLTGAGLSYFGIKGYKPDLLPAFARNNPSDTDKVLILVGAAGLYYVWSQGKKKEKELTAELDAMAQLPPRTPDVSVSKPGGGMVRPSARRAGAVPSAEQVPPGPPPSHDSNMPWWPDQNKNMGYLGQDSWVAWATGAEEGEGYIPDDWWVIGTKDKVKDTASSAVTTAAEAAGKGAGTAVGTATEKALPSWLIPTLALGGLSLAAYWVYRRA